MTITFDFAGRTVLVTGAAQGIGKALAENFAASSARVIVADRDANLLKQEWHEDSSSLLLLELDVTDGESVRERIDQVVQHWGSVDVVINNAGIARDAMVWKMTDDQWDTVLAVHVTGTFNVTRAVVPHMRTARFGRIINVTSYTGMHGNIGQSNYAAAKGASSPSLSRWPRKRLGSGLPATRWWRRSQHRRLRP